MRIFIELLMGSSFGDCMAALRPKADLFQSRSMGLCRVGRQPIRSRSGRSNSSGLNASFGADGRALHGSPLAPEWTSIYEFLHHFQAVRSVMGAWFFPDRDKGFGSCTADISASWQRRRGDHGTAAGGKSARVASRGQFSSSRLRFCPGRFFL